MDRSVRFQSCCADEEGGSRQASKGVHTGRGEQEQEGVVSTDTTLRGLQVEGQQPGYPEKKCGQSYSDNDFHLKIERYDSYLKMTALVQLYFLFEFSFFNYSESQTIGFSY